MRKEDSIYCQDCVSLEYTPAARSDGIPRKFPVCRSCVTSLRTDRYGQVVKCKKCIASDGGNYV